MYHRALGQELRLQASEAQARVEPSDEAVQLDGDRSTSRVLHTGCSHPVSLLGQVRDVCKLAHTPAPCKLALADRQAPYYRRAPYYRQAPSDKCATSDNHVIRHDDSRALDVSNDMVHSLVYAPNV